jgi:TPP-dependent pyruvate/acetoin dehydrogenase alpha subunit
VVEDAAAEIEAAVAAAEAVEPFEPGAIFDRMYASPTPAMDRQRSALRRDDADG